MSEDRPDIIAGEAGGGDADKPEWLQERLKWFSSLKLGLFLHWGIYSQWGCIESWPLVEEDTWARPDDLPAWVERGKDIDRFRKDYFALNRTFNPTAFDPEAWAEEARNAGMKYVAFTTKHHDGFSMFDTRQTDYRITHPDCPFSSNPRANVTKAVFDAFRAQEMAISCYFSKSDWHCPYYWDPARSAKTRNPNYDTQAEPERWEQFVQFVHGQIGELMTGYGPLDCLWLDGGQVRPPSQDLRMAEIAAMARSHQPGLIMADRTVGGDYEDILTPEQQIPDEPLGQTWESCLTMGTSWAYKPNEVYKPTRQLLQMLMDIVAKGGNLLLGIGPTPEGTFPAGAVERLRDLGAWLAVNGDAVYDTEPVAPYTDGQVRYTRRGNRTYATWIAGEGQAAPERVLLKGLAPAEGSAVRVLGRPEPLTWRFTDQGAEVEVPEVFVAGKDAWVITFRR